MPDCLPCIYAVLFNLLLIHAASQVCPVGWFGPSCRFKCHCRDDYQCDPNGDCPQDIGCHDDYFGSGCQYVSLNAYISTPGNPSFLTDNNDETCNPDREATSLVLQMMPGIVLSWFRIVATDDRHLETFTTLVNSEPCSREKKFKVNNRTVHVSCDAMASVHRIVILGEIVSRICSIRISGGRNLALKQPTKQSSNFDGDVIKYGSDNAVNGYRDGQVSQTSLEKSEPVWELTFLFPANIYYINVHSDLQKEVNMQELQEMTVEIIALSGSSIKLNVGNFELSRFENVPTRNPVKSIKIKKSAEVSVRKRRLILHEVEALGETICPIGRYGLLCNKNCKCANSEVCDVHTGACSPGCNVGFYGTDCSQPCSSACFFGICNHISGKCIHCKPGFKGESCTQACDNGTFGSGCSIICSNGCADTCNHITGYCTCRKRFSGGLCSACVVGYFGLYCDIQCSMRCAGICNRENGTCVCKREFQGALCKECADGLYGPNCETLCPVGCFDGTCDRVTGFCSGCSENLEGPHCQVAEPAPGKYWLSIIPLSIVVPIVFYICYSENKRANASHYKSKITVTHPNQRKVIPVVKKLSKTHESSV